MTRSETSPEPMAIDLSQRGAVVAGAEIANIIVTVYWRSRSAIDPHLPHQQRQKPPCYRYRRAFSDHHFSSSCAAYP